MYVGNGTSADDQGDCTLVGKYHHLQLAVWRSDQYDLGMDHCRDIDRPNFHGSGKYQLISADYQLYSANSRVIWLVPCPLLEDCTFGHIV